MNIDRVALLILTSILASCVGTTVTSDHLPESTTFAEGEGLVFGSFLVTVPGEVESPEQKEMIKALRARELTATIRRFVRHGPPGGGFTWRDYQGDEFIVTWHADGEQPFVLRGPAGTYQILSVKNCHEGLFLDDHWCELEDPGDFEVHAGETTYVGTLVLETAFKSEQQLQWAKLRQGLGASEFPERLLDMKLSVVEAMASTLRELDVHGAFAAQEIRTELMSAGSRGWDLKRPPPVELPKPPPK